jgi:Na+-transporting NADH:ubiquinone oxidoreductase subunit C
MSNGGGRAVSETGAVNINSTGYTIRFALVVCLVCAALVSVSAVLLQPRQKANALLYMEKNVLVAASLAEPGEALSIAEVEDIFARQIETRLVDLTTGEVLPTGVRDARRFDQRAARNDPAESRVAPPNDAGIRRLPREAVVYFVKTGGAVNQVVIPVEGLGMWGTIYGFMALSPDAKTILGLTFYEHRETPGLGGEISNPDWLSLWRGRMAYDEAGKAAIAVVKGPAGPPSDDPLRVDGLSGATVTSNAVTELVQFWLDENGYGPFLQRLRNGDAL